MNLVCESVFAMDYFEFPWTALLWGAIALVVSFALSTVVMILVLIRLPATFFHDANSWTLFQSAHPALRWAGRITKNLVGILAILLGMALALPGIPGPGLAILVVGIMLVDFPGRRRLVRRLISHPRVLSTLNSWRGRFGRSPLLSESRLTDRCSKKRRDARSIVKPHIFPRLLPGGTPDPEQPPSVK